MSINPSSAIAKALSRAAGEAYVSYSLARFGWLAVNTNVGLNMPNVDIVALKGKRLITIQVKAAKADKSVPLAGSFKADGTYFNSKIGPQADFVVAVAIPRKIEVVPVCYVFPVKAANKLAKKIGNRIAHTKKRDGSQRSQTFPIWLKGKDRSLADDFRNKWEVLDRGGD